ncbi:AMP-binding protein [Myxococcota bacterium]|nr:AMP-binding protein [Myxococcota bacterium]
MSGQSWGSLWDLIEWRVAETPDARFCLDDAGRELSFTEYRDSIERAAAGLQALGIGEGTAVTWILPTRVSALILMGALSRLGAVQNPVIPIYRHREVDFVTRQTGASFLIVPTEFRGFDYAGMAGELAQENPELEVLVVEHDLPEGDPSALPPPPPSCTPDEAPVRWIFYTSGTTSDPKGARHTDQTLLATSVGFSRTMDLQPGESIGLVFPVTHIGGANWLMAALISGSHHLVVEIFGPESVDFLSEQDVRHAGSGTAFFNLYLSRQREHPEKPLFPNVRTFPGGGAPKPPTLHQEMKSELGGYGIIAGYGLTECPIIAMCTTEDPDDKLAVTEGKVNPSHARIRVVKLDGSPAAPGEEGELRVWGPQLCKGYLDTALNDAGFDDEGFFLTGDLGFVDEDGYVVITGRVKDVIIRNAENISAKEIEDLLYEHPKVADVAVVGLPDPKTGERACAVVASTSAGDNLAFEEMVDYLKSKRMMMQKIPEQLEIVDEIPRNPSGKILKNQLRETYGGK